MVGRARPRLRLGLAGGAPPSARSHDGVSILLSFARRIVPVIARIESHRSGRVWGYWFSKHTPEGHFHEVPVGRVVALLSDDDADELLRLIRAGRELPAEFVQRLHVIAD